MCLISLHKNIIAEGILRDDFDKTEEWFSKNEMENIMENIHYKFLHFLKLLFRSLNNTATLYCSYYLFSNVQIVWNCVIQQL